MHDYTGAFGDRVFLSAHEAHFSVIRERQNPACAPARVFLQKERRKPVFQGRFAGKQKSPPQPVSFFAPTNVGIHALIRLKIGFASMLADP
ncbi:MAG: hypothetical protein PHI27_04510 [Eubacteriales bacterium]|nr:hypothetical protein [Eubacteriales bacterium]MDD4513019.1 hypothetical protein [Eubacteriales bacterium]